MFSACARVCLNSGTALFGEILTRFSCVRRASTSRPERGFSGSRARLRPLAFGGTVLVRFIVHAGRCLVFECTFLDVGDFNELLEVALCVLEYVFGWLGELGEDLCWRWNRVVGFYSSGSNSSVHAMQNRREGIFNREWCIYQIPWFVSKLQVLDISTHPSSSVSISSMLSTYLSMAFWRSSLGRFRCCVTTFPDTVMTLSRGGNR